MRNSRLKTIQTTNPVNAKAIFNILTPSLVAETDLRLTLPDILLLSAIHAEINEVLPFANDEEKLSQCNAFCNLGSGLQVTRMLKPNYLLERYPLLHFTSTKRIKEIRLKLYEMHLIEYSHDFINLTRTFHNQLFSTMAAIRGIGFINVPQYAIVTHDTLWRLSPTHIIIGIAIIRILQAKGLRSWIDAKMLQQITGLDMSYRQYCRYIDDLIDLKVLARVKDNVSQRFILRIGDEGHFLLIESDKVLQSNAVLFYNAS